MTCDMCDRPAAFEVGMPRAGDGWGPAAISRCVLHFHEAIDIFALLVRDGVPLIIQTPEDPR